MSQKLLGVELREGLVFNMCRRTFFGWMIRRALGKAYKRLGGHDPYRNCPSHSAMVVRVNGKLWIGEVRKPVATLMPIDQYILDLESGLTYNLRILAVAGATRQQEQQASEAWLLHVLNSPYDRWGIIRLLFKVCGCDIHWANWCTEGNERAFRAAGLDPYKNENPTPLTEFKRWLSRAFICLNPNRTSLSHKSKV